MMIINLSINSKFSNSKSNNSRDKTSSLRKKLMSLPLSSMEIIKCPRKKPFPAKELQKRI